MKIISFLLLIALLLSGCSLKEGVSGKYKQENVLHAKVTIPHQINLNEETNFSVTFTEKSGKEPILENTEFLIWKKGKEKEVEALTFTKKNGSYHLKKTFKEDGIYFLKVKANTKESKIMPTKQLVVGNIEKADLNKESEQEHNDHHGDHH